MGGIAFSWYQALLKNPVTTAGCLVGAVEEEWIVVQLWFPGSQSSIGYVEASGEEIRSWISFLYKMGIVNKIDTYSFVI
jgi:hypothetical protein